MSKQLANIHDAFFKRALSDPQRASTFLHEHLPPHVASLLGPEPAELLPGSIVDEELRQHHTDLLFRVHLKSGHDALTYVLVEHKSSPDPVVRLQLLRYVVQILLRWYDQNKRALPLPVVLPVLVHQGPEGWTWSCEFADLFGTVPEALRPYLPSFNHALIDLARIDDSRLSTEVPLRAYLKALKYIQRPDLPLRMRIVLAETPELLDTDTCVIVTYLENGPIKLDSAVIADTLSELIPDRKEKIMGWITQPHYEKGRAEGEAKILTRLLEKRFGELAPSLRARILGANIESIEMWVERAFDAPDLQSVFDLN